MVTLIVIALCLALIGCQTMGEDKGKEDGKETVASQPATGDKTGDGVKGKKIGFIQLTLGTTYHASMSDKFEELCKENDVKLSMVASSSRTAEEQLKLAEDLIAQGVDALVLNPVGDEIVPKIVQLAKDAGIPMICVDNTSPGEGYTYIGIDNFAIARGIGQYIGANYDGGKMVYVRSTATDTGCPAYRYGGIMGGMSDEGEIAGFDMIDERYAMTDVGEGDGLKQMEELLAANDQIDIVLVHHDGQALGALTAIKNANRTDIKVMAGFDGELKLFEAIKEHQGGANGIDIVTGLNSPIMIAQMTLDALETHFSGGEMSSSYFIPVIIISYDNVDDYMEYGF